VGQLQKKPETDEEEGRASPEEEIVLLWMGILMCLVPADPF